MKFFLTQKLVESRRFMNRMRKEADTLKDYIAQLTAIIAELEAMADQDEVHDSLLAVKDAKRMPLFNELRFVKVKRPADVVVGSVVVFAEVNLLALGLIWLCSDGNGLVWFVLGVCRLCPYGCGVRKIDIRLMLKYICGVGNGALGVWVADNVFQNLVCLEVAQLNMVSVMHNLSHCTPMSPLSFIQRISLSKKRRLVAELEALGEREGAAKPFEHMKEIVAHDAVMLGELETLLAHALVGVSLKASFIADMEEKAVAFGFLNWVDVVNCGTACVSYRVANPKPIARRVIDEFVEFSRETEITTQLNAMIVEMEAIDDPNEVYDSLKCLREDMLAENDKLMGLNKFVVDAEEDIDMKEGHIQMLEAAGESD
ncbi:hypothetical protein Tco_0735119 [Tanacetum coccineum]